MIFKVLPTQTILELYASKHAEDRHCKGKETSEGEMVPELAKHTQWEGLELDGPCSANRALTKARRALYIMKSSVLKHVSLISYCIWQSNPSQIDLMLSSRSFGNFGRVVSPCWWLLLGLSEMSGWLSLPAGGTWWLGPVVFHGGRESLPKQKA